MSTTSETKFVAYLRKLQTTLDSSPLSYIAKIYDDSPREDINATGQFPRLQVKEVVSSSSFSGIGNTNRLYSTTLEATIFVDMMTPFDYTDAKISAFWSASRNMSPEEATGAIAYHISKEVAQNKATLHTDNSNKFLLRGNTSYTDMGIDNTYFKNLNVYKGSISFDFYLRD